MPTPLPRNVRLLGAASFANDVASEMVYPLLPEFLLRFLGGNRVHLGLIEGTAETVASLLKLAAGDLSDRFRRRKPLVLAGYLLAAFSRPLAAASTLPWHLLGLRVLDRTGKGIRTSPRDAMIADSTEPSQRGRAYGFHRAMDHLGAALGPLLAMGFLALRPGDLRSLFLLTLAPGIAVAAIVLLGLRESPRAPAPAAEAVPPPPVGEGKSRFPRFLLAVMIFTLGNSSDAFLLVRARELGIAASLLPLLWLVHHLVKSGGNLLAGRWTDRHGPTRMLLTGWLLYAAVYAGFGLASSPWHAWALFLAYGAYYGFCEPAERVLVARWAPRHARGRRFGWFHLAVGIATLPASLFFGFLYERAGAPAAFLWGAGAALAAAALFAGARPDPAEEIPVHA